MKGVEKTIRVGSSIQRCFACFVHDFGSWWPQGYTWSQEQLVEISIDAQVDGLCTEIGPHGFRIDWGRVLAIGENELIEFTWQISPERVPLPDPAQASIVSVRFKALGHRQSHVILSHDQFDAHGDQGSKYMKMMDGQYGWSYLLERFRTYCEDKS